VRNPLCTHPHTTKAAYTSHVAYRSRPKEQTLLGQALRHAAHLLLLAGSLHAQSRADQPSPAPPHYTASRTYFGQDIFVAPGQQIHNATCLFCSVQIDGDLSGNVFVLFGNLTVTGRVEGNVDVIGGNTVVDSQARIGGRTVVVDGNAVYETDDALSGDAYVVGGHISGFNRRASPHRRLSLNPVFSAALAFVAVLLLAALILPLSRRRLLRS